MKKIKWEDLYTSPEQSKRLMKLGLDSETADCVYCKYATKPARGDEDLNSVLEQEDGSWLYLDFHEDFHDIEGGDILCWSLGALIDLMPGELKDYACKDHSVDLLIHKEGVEYFDETGMQHGPGFKSTLLDASVEMIEWLLEKGYIEKHDRK